MVQPPYTDVEKELFSVYDVADVRCVSDSAADYRLDLKASTVEGIESERGSSDILEMVIDCVEGAVDCEWVRYNDDGSLFVSVDE
jgi:hypothetical protein